MALFFVIPDPESDCWAIMRSFNVPSVWYKYLAVRLVPPTLFSTSHHNQPSHRTSFTPTAAGTESVPVAVSPGQSSEIANVAALQLLSAAMATLTQASKPAAALALAAEDVPAPAPTIQSAGAAPVSDTAAPAIQSAGAAPVSDTAAPAAQPAHAPGGFLTKGPWIAGSLFVVVPQGPMLPVAEDPLPAETEGPYWYSITKGRYVGVTRSNALALASVTGISAGSMKAYKTQALALAAFNEMLQYHMVVVVA
ncbi:hypothetical protein B0H11DRAFT_2215006 [Mycena galericulata]|nr:hypothetical protein B0H11DRAFT_2215006 [Mycena galericulata]